MTRRTRGRPRDPGESLALLAAARALFLEHGADVVTVDQVIAGARVSRATYYGNFAGRDDLLAAVIGAESERIVTHDAARLYEGLRLVTSEAYPHVHGAGRVTKSLPPAPASTGRSAGRFRRRRCRSFGLQRVGAGAQQAGFDQAVRRRRGGPNGTSTMVSCRD